MTPALNKAGRALLGWSQGRLAEAAKIAERTVAGYERGERTIHENSVDAMRRALEAAGIVIIEDGGDAGVLLRTKPAPKKAPRRE